MEGDNDILDDIRQTQETKNWVDDIQTATLMGTQWGLWIGLSWFNDPAQQTQGMLLFIVSIFAMAMAWMYPSYKAAIIAGSRIYLKAIVYHGSFFTERQFEIIDAPKIVACLEENDVTVYEDDLNYDDLLNSLGITNLTDIDIDQRVKDAFNERYRLEQEKQENNGGKIKWLKQKLKRE